jgi:sugar phosphate isomerase/epimerase
LASGIEHEFEMMKERIRSTHIHDNDGREDQHLFPNEGAIDWGKTMSLLRSRPGQYPLLLELRERPDREHPIKQAREAMDGLIDHT